MYPAVFALEIFNVKDDFSGAILIFLCELVLLRINSMVVRTDSFVSASSKNILMFFGFLINEFLNKNKQIF